MSEKVLFGLATSEVIDKFNVVVQRCGSLSQAITHLLNKDRLLKRKYRFQQPTNCVVWEETMDQRRDNFNAVLQMLDSYVRFNRLDSRSAALEELLQAADVEKQPIDLPPGGALEQRDQWTQTATVEVTARREEYNSMMMMMQQRRGQNDVSSQTNLVLLQHASIQTIGAGTAVDDDELVKQEVRRRRKRAAPQKQRMTVSGRVGITSQVIPPGSPVTYTCVKTPPFITSPSTGANNAMENAASGISIANIRSLATPLVRQRIGPGSYPYPYPATPMLYSQQKVTSGAVVSPPQNEWKGAACGDYNSSLNGSSVVNDNVPSDLSAKSSQIGRQQGLGESGKKKEVDAVHAGKTKRMRRPPTYYQSTNESSFHRITKRERRWLSK